MTKDTRKTYAVRFHGGKLGTLRLAHAVTISAYDTTELATRIYKFALQRLPKAVMEVELDPDVLLGRIITSWSTIATFEAEEIAR